MAELIRRLNDLQVPLRRDEFFAVERAAARAASLGTFLKDVFKPLSGARRRGAAQPRRRSRARSTRVTNRQRCRP
jgi:hypothetical protein